MKLGKDKRESEVCKWVSEKTESVTQESETKTNKEKERRPRQDALHVACMGMAQVLHPDGGGQGLLQQPPRLLQDLP